MTGKIFTVEIQVARYRDVTVRARNEEEAKIIAERWAAVKYENVAETRVSYVREVSKDDLLFDPDDAIGADFENCAPAD